MVFIYLNNTIYVIFYMLILEIPYHILIMM